jgi:hypothetical protein
MANTTVTKVTVIELTKYGFKDQRGLYIGYSKQLKDADKVNIVPGRTLEVEMYVADSGKEYVNKVLSHDDVKPTNNLPKTVAKIPGTTSGPVVYKKTETATEAMTRADWDAKDTRISRQGAIQAAVQAVAHLGLTATKDVFPTAEKLAEQMLEFVNEK